MPTCATPKDQIVIDRYEQNLLSGLAFDNCARSAGSIIGYQPPCGHRDYAKALKVLAAGAALSDRQATVISAVLQSLPLHQTRGETVQKMYATASEALRRGYFDTINHASPEPGRYSDNQHEYTLVDRITLMHTLNHAAACVLPTGSVTGWCLAALTERDHVYPVVTEKVAP